MFYILNAIDTDKTNFHVSMSIYNKNCLRVFLLFFKLTFWDMAQKCMIISLFFSTWLKIWKIYKMLLKL